MPKNNHASNILNIKQANSRNVYQLFFQHKRLSKPQIVKLLNLSLPTVVNNICKLEREGKIKESGQFRPQGGRPATGYSLVEDAFISIGIAIYQHHIRCIALNLKGTIIHNQYISFYFENNANYIATLCHAITQFIAKSGYSAERILGIGVSVQGIADKNGEFMLYGKVINCASLKASDFSPYLSHPVKLFHDVKCAALTELWFSKKINNAIYVSISEHLGGAIILNGQIDFGKKGYSGALEHLQIHENGNLCYCGQRGCLETYCSISALLTPDETIELFFDNLRNGNVKTKERWNIYLHHLAKGLNSVYLLLERNIILGGEISYYLIDEDLEILQSQMEEISTFPIDKPIISIALQQKHTSAIGAALPFLITYLPN